jgi:hypothetical protein
MIGRRLCVAPSNTQPEIGPLRLASCAGRIAALTEIMQSHKAKDFVLNMEKTFPELSPPG